MRNRLIIAILGLISVLTAVAQQDKRLKERLDSVLMYTQQSKFASVLDFTYPKLFKIVPREQLMKTMNESMNTEEFTMSLDSVMVTKIHPVFTINNGSYIKINHTMLMLMKFKEPIDTADSESLDFMLGLLKNDYGEKNVRFDVANNTFRIFALSDLIAIKDEYSPEWSFVNFDSDEGSPLAPLIFSKEVLEKIKTFN
jgi:hypothetical protein